MFRASLLRRLPPAAAAAAASAAAGKATPAAPQQRVYRSTYDSILPALEKERSLATYMFGRWAAAKQDRLALLQAETKDQLTYKQLRDTTERFAEILYHEYGIRKGDVVCLLMLDNIYYPAIVYAVMRLGGIVTTSNAITTPEALCPQLEQARAKVLVSSHPFSPLVDRTVAMYAGTTGTHLRPLLIEDVVEKLRGGETAGAIPSSYTAMEEADPHDTIFIPFSSGTTGAPKGVQLTNRNLVASLMQGQPIVPFDENKDVLLSVLPFFHIYGFTNVMCGPLHAGCAQVVMSKYAVDVFLQCVQEHRVSMAFLAPPIINSIIGRLDGGRAGDYDLSSWNFISCSAAPVSPAYVDRLKQLLPQVQLLQGWGMTETSPLVTGPPRGRMDFPPYSGGTLAPDTELRVVKVGEHQQSGEDKSEGIDCETGEDGELWVRGPQVMKGYLDPKETAKVVVQGGWFRTGDIGRYDDSIHGVYVTDRLKELIKYKGFQVSPVQVEAEISKHPWVQDCVVVGVHDVNDISYEVPRGLVVLKASVTPEERAKASDAIYDFIKQHCPPHKRLHGGVRIVDSLLKNASGKVMRRQIRQAENEHIRYNGRQ